MKLVVSEEVPGGREDKKNKHYTSLGHKGSHSKSECRVALGTKDLHRKTAGRLSAVPERGILVET